MRKQEFLDNDDVRSVNEEALTKIDGSSKMRHLFLFLPKLQISKTEKEIIQRNEVQAERNRRNGLTLVGDYDLCDNHGEGDGKRVRNSHGGKQLGNSQRTLKQGNAIMSKARSMGMGAQEMPGMGDIQKAETYNSYGGA